MENYVDNLPYSFFKSITLNINIYKQNKGELIFKLEEHYDDPDAIRGLD